MFCPKMQHDYKSLSERNFSMYEVGVGLSRALDKTNKVYNATR